MVRRTRTGTVSSPSPGSNITIVPMRANTRIKTAASAGRNEMSIFMPLLAEWTIGRDGRLLDADDPCGEAEHLGLQLVRHERQRDDHGEKHRQDLRHEDERHLLNLGDRLQQ